MIKPELNAAGYIARNMSALDQHAALANCNRSDAAICHPRHDNTARRAYAARATTVTLQNCPATHSFGIPTAPHAVPHARVAEVSQACSTSQLTIVSAALGHGEHSSNNSNDGAPKRMVGL